MIKRLCQAVLIGISFWIATSVIAANNTGSNTKYYRYINSNGELIISDQIPPEVGAHGYEVIDKNGRVKETVDPMLTEEERQAKIEEAKRKENDKRILGLYASYEEIDRVRDSNISQIDATILIIQGNIKGLIEQRSGIQEEAAKLERIGKQVPAETTKQLFAIDSTIKNENKKLQDQQETKKQILDKFAADRIRLGELLHLPSPTAVPNAELQPLAVPVGTSPTASTGTPSIMPESTSSVIPVTTSSATENISPSATGNSP